jgi:hypothetical protein
MYIDLFGWSLLRDSHYGMRLNRLNSGSFPLGDDHHKASHSEIPVMVGTP